MWWEVVFWVLLVPVLVILGIVYGTGKKIYKLLFVLATYTYITLATYVIDVFNLGRNWILSILVFSAVLLILIGLLMSKSSEKNKKKTKKNKSKNKSKTQINLYLTILLLALMLVLIIIGTTTTKLTKSIQVIDSINSSFINQAGAEVINGQPIPKQSSDSINLIRLMTITYQNNGLLPAPITEKNFKACVYDSKGEGQEAYLETEPENYRNYGEVSPGKTKKLFVNLRRLYVDNSLKPTMLIITAFSDDLYHDCSELSYFKDKANVYEEIPII